MELVEGEKVAVSGSESGDEYAVEMEDRPLRETFSVKLLFCPSGKNPTEISGTIVYATTAVICTSALLPSPQIRVCGWNSPSNIVASFPSAVLITVLCIILANCLTKLLTGHVAVLVSCVVLFLLCVVCIIIIWRQPESAEALTFKVTVSASLAQALIPLLETLAWLATGQPP